MFYKRISDLHPLAQVKDSNNPDWSKTEPVPIPSSEIGKFYEISTQYVADGIPYTKLSNSLPTKITSDIPILSASFNTTEWRYKTDNSASTNPYTRSNVKKIEDDPSNISSEYYTKSLWFEVNVAKDENNAPTSKPDKIKKYQAKKMNAWLMMTNLDEISADIISAGYIHANNGNCQNLNAIIINGQILSAATIVNTGYADFKDLSATSINTTGISADVGIIDNISGSNMYYNQALFNDISVFGKAELTAEAAYWADVAELYLADQDYPAGTLMKFGGEAEVTIANDKSNAVVSEKPAILLNNEFKNKKHATPIVLTGRSKVRTIHPVKKFDKIYLSETPGIGSISSYKVPTANTPIGIALEDKLYDAEGLVECILQLNFE